MSIEPTDGKLGINVEFASPKMEALSEGFNKYGVRENDDGSIDVRFNAMEPGTRKGYNITPEFLQRVASQEYDRIPVQLDHDDSQRKNVGYIESQNIKFADNFLRLQVHIPNTGSSVRDDVIADFTHEPPAIEDISIGLDPKSVDVEPPSEDGENPKFTNGRLREVSLTPFPGGYDNGGLTPAFTEAVEEATAEFSEDDGGDGSTGEPESQLITKQLEIK